MAILGRLLPLNRRRIPQQTPQITGQLPNFGVHHLGFAGWGWATTRRWHGRLPLYGRGGARPSRHHKIHTRATRLFRGNMAHDLLRLHRLGAGFAGGRRARWWVVRWLAHGRTCRPWRVHLPVAQATPAPAAAEKVRDFRFAILDLGAAAILRRFVALPRHQPFPHFQIGSPRPLLKQAHPPPAPSPK